MPAETIEEVIGHLHNIIERARLNRSRKGFFAVLYRHVTVRVREGIDAGRFEDPHRMERLAVNFANRYLEAETAYYRDEPTSQCWSAAFEACSWWMPLVLQHLLLGMNAHINLDLGIAAAQTCPGKTLQDLKPDFDEINVILGEMLDEVQARVGRISPWLEILDAVGGRSDEVVSNFCLRAARDDAWDFAQTLTRQEGDHLEAVIQRVDRATAMRARRILYPGLLVTPAMLVIRLRESSDVVYVLETLMD